MNNHRLLTGLLAATLMGGGVQSFGQSDGILTLEDLFTLAETNSVQLHPALSGEEEATVLPRARVGSVNPSDPQSEGHT